MKRELEHFYIGSSYGGNQDWFPTFMMHIGGCGAETACDSSIYFAIHRGLKRIAPGNAASLTKDDYIRFAYQMKPYLSPRMTGWISILTAMPNTCAAAVRPAYP